VLGIDRAEVGLVYFSSAQEPGESPGTWLEVNGLRGILRLRSGLQLVTRHRGRDHRGSRRFLQRGPMGKSAQDRADNNVAASNTKGE
jgi:hypothetical protein